MFCKVLSINLVLNQYFKNLAIFFNFDAKFLVSFIGLFLSLTNRNKKTISGRKSQSLFFSVKRKWTENLKPRPIGRKSICQMLLETGWTNIFNKLMGWIKNIKQKMFMASLEQHGRWPSALKIKRPLECVTMTRIPNRAPGSSRLQRNTLTTLNASKKIHC